MIKSNISLKEYNTYKTGGEAEYFAKVSNVSELVQAKNFAIENNLPVNIIGKGSNLLISSNLIKGLTIVNSIKGCEIDEENQILTVGSGESISCVAKKVAKKGYLCLEWAAGIPATIGGAITMNAGAHKKSIEDVLIDVVLLSRKNNLVVLTNDDLDFSYRYSYIQQSNYIVTSARFKLTKEEYKGQALDLYQQHVDYRFSTQPYNQPSCGSVFRNPLNKHAGALIESCYLKGFNFMGAEVSAKHSNFIINKGDATSESIYKVMSFVKDKVKERYDINLIQEVKLLGDF